MAAASVFCINITLVMGPVPPGTGVMRAAIRRNPGYRPNDEYECVSLSH